ncbi:MAG TPA: hypothetical protein VH834_06090 [Solirubrobacteraceae bacterium]|jgi:hypothetical protein
MARGKNNSRSRQNVPDYSIVDPDEIEKASASISSRSRARAARAV